MKLYKKDEAIAALINYKAEIEFALACLDAINENLQVYIPQLETHSEFSNEISKVCLVNDGQKQTIERFVSIKNTYIAAEMLNDKHTHIDDDGKEVSVIDVFIV